MKEMKNCMPNAWRVNINLLYLENLKESDLDPFKNPEMFLL